MSNRRFAQFALDERRARDLVGLGQSIGALTQGAVDAADLYRAGLVQGVAALDAYIHGIVLDRAVDIMLGRLEADTGGLKLGLNFGAVGQLLAAPSPSATELLARSLVAERLALETFQRPDNIGSALSLVGIPKIWSGAFPGSSQSRV